LGTAGWDCSSARRDQNREEGDGAYLEHGRNHPAPTPSLPRAWSQPSRIDPLAPSRMVATTPPRPPRSRAAEINHPRSTPRLLGGWSETSPDRPPTKFALILDHPRTTAPLVQTALRPQPIDPRAPSARFATVERSPAGRSSLVRNHPRSTAGVASAWSQPSAIDRGGRSSLVATIPQVRVGSSM
jgi:hypothetical protein